MFNSARLALGLGLAASPTFATLALLNAVQGSAATSQLCADMPGFPLGGMTAMYALMSLFHLAPWLRLLAGRRHAS